MPSRLLLLRHGESTWNARGLWQGWADPPLSPLGEQQSARAVAALAEAGLTGLASSDLRRARQTAEIVGRALGLTLQVVDAGLRERDVGEWCGLSRDQIEEGWPGAVAAWREQRLPAPPGGERNDDFRRRVVETVSRLMTREELGAQPLVVTHGGVLRALDRHLGLEPPPSENLAGRWYEADGEGALRAGARVAPLGPNGYFNTSSSPATSTRTVSPSE